MQYTKTYQKFQQMDSNLANRNSTPASKKVSGRWTRTEHDRFIKALEKFGRDWISVQKYVKTRNLTQVRSHAQKVFMKMSSSDIDAMILGEGDSDFQSFGCQHETAYQKKYRSTKKETQNKKESQAPTQKPQPIHPGHKEDLLEIFKRAIQLELSQESLDNPNVIINQIPETPSQHENTPKQQQPCQKQNQSENEPLQAHEVYNQDTKQMQFSPPDIAKLFETSGTLAH